MRQCPHWEQLFQTTTEVCASDGARLLPQDPLLGAALDDKYQIERLLGAGGMGSVYRARQLALDRLVAVKVIRGSLAVEDEAVRRFKREALAYAFGGGRGTAPE